MGGVFKQKHQKQRNHYRVCRSLGVIPSSRGPAVKRDGHYRETETVSCWYISLDRVFVRILNVAACPAAFAGSRARGRSGIRPGRESTVWRVEERASLVKSTQTYICRTAVRTRGLIRPRFTRSTPDRVREHDFRAGRHLAPLGVSARRFQAAGPKHRASSPGVRSR